MAAVETDFADGVLTVTLADEENRNALSARLTSELVEALDAADSDPEVRVVVLTNAGRVFCAGADLSERSSGDGPAGERSARVVSPVDLFGRFRHSPKPYVGRIAGHCVAGGMGLAAAMDISIAVEDAHAAGGQVVGGALPVGDDVGNLDLGGADVGALLRGHHLVDRLRVIEGQRARGEALGERGDGGHGGIVHQHASRGPPIFGRPPRARCSGGALRRCGSPRCRSRA